MWYLVGCIENYKRISIFAVDRMSEVNILEDHIEEKVEFDTDDYFKNSFGVTVIDEEPVKITLEFGIEQKPYIKNFPLHSSQKIIEDNEYGLIVSVFLSPDYEFYSKILSYGSYVKVLTPSGIVDKIVMKVKETLEQY